MSRPTDHAHDTLIRTYLPKIRSTVNAILSRQGTRQRAEREDCMQEGCIALLHAASKYKKTRHVKFWTYAQHMVRGAVLEYLRSRKVDPLGRWCRARLSPAEQRALWISLARHSFPAQQGRWRVPLFHDDALEEGTHPHRAYTQGIYLSRRGLSPQEEHAEVAEATTAVTAALTTLSALQQRVLHASYWQGTPLKEIAATQDRHESRMSQVRTEALATLRHKCHGGKDLWETH